MKITTIIVAGGSGSRMGTETPKQFLLLRGLPVLMRTIQSLKEAIGESVDNYVNNFVVVLPHSQIDQWRKLCREYDFNIEHQVIAGGDNRFASVKNGLSLVQDTDLVIVHDGVRPFASKATVMNVIETAQRTGAAIPVIEVIDSLRRIVNNMSITVNRSEFKSVQTPQCFKKEVILGAYEQSYDPSFTDDASVVERAGHKIELTNGNTENIKITTPADLDYANYLLENYGNKQ